MSDTPTKQELIAEELSHASELLCEYVYELRCGNQDFAELSTLRASLDLAQDQFRKSEAERVVFQEDCVKLSKQLAEREAKIEHLDKVCGEFSAEILKWENEEASVCPEDVGFVEFIGVLQKRLAERDRQLVVLREAAYDADATLCSCRYQPSPADCNCDIHAAHRILQAALASTSSAAERVERRIGEKYLDVILGLAQELHYAIDMQDEYSPTEAGRKSLRKADDILNAAALDRPDGKEEGNG